MSGGLAQKPLNRSIFASFEELEKAAEERRKANPPQAVASTTPMNTMSTDFPGSPPAAQGEQSLRTPPAQQTAMSTEQFVSTPSMTTTTESRSVDDTTNFVREESPMRPQPSSISGGGYTLVPQTSTTVTSKPKAEAEIQALERAESADAVLKSNNIRKEQIFQDQIDKIALEGSEKTALTAKQWHEELSKAQDDRKERAIKFFSDYDKALNDLQQLEPSKRSYWDLSSTAGKISGLLSVIGSTLISLGTRDPSFISKASAKIDEAIEKDLEQQRMKYERSKALLGEKKEAFQARYGLDKDVEAVLQAKKTMALEDIKLKLDNQVAKVKNEQDRAKAQASADSIYTELSTKQADRRFAVAQSGSISTTSTLTPMKGEAGKQTLPGDEDAAFNEMLQKMGVKGPSSTQKSDLEKTLEYSRGLDTFDKYINGTPEEKAAAGPAVGFFIAKTMDQGSFTPELRDQMVAAGLSGSLQENIAKLTGNVEKYISPQRLEQIRNWMKSKEAENMQVLGPQIIRVKNLAEQRGVDSEVMLPGITSAWRRQFSKKGK